MQETVTVFHLDVRKRDCNIRSYFQNLLEKWTQSGPGIESRCPVEKRIPTPCVEWISESMPLACIEISVNPAQQPMNRYSVIECPVPVLPLLSLSEAVAHLQIYIEMKDI